MIMRWLMRMPLWNFGSIRTKLQAIVLIIVMMSATLIAGNAIISMVHSYRAMNNEFHSAILDTYKKNLKFHVGSITLIINSYTQSIQNQIISPATINEIK